MRSALIVALLLVVACAEPASVETTTSSSSTTAPTTTTTSVPTDDATAALNAARARWDAAASDTYHFTFFDDCGECMPENPRLITVWDGNVYDGRGQGIDIDSMFQVIESAIADGRTVEASYDPELGYPTDLWIDQEARAYDGGTHLLISDLRSGLPGQDVALADLEAALDLWETSRPEGYEFRTDIVCGCPFEVTTWTVVDGDRIVDWVVERGTADVAPITIDALFSDLRDLIAEGEVVEGGARITGSATYDPTLGYPIWVGLDIEVLDPDSELGGLPPRLVFSVRDFAEREGGDAALETAVRRWADVGPASYSYELTIHDVEEGSFSEPYVVEVSFGTLTSVTQNGEAVHPDNLPAYEIDELFGLIEQWQNVGYVVDVLFDQRLGHPVLVTVATETEVFVFSIDALRPR